MEIAITVEDLMKHGLDKNQASLLLDEIKAQITINSSAEEVWKNLSQTVLAGKYPFSIHLSIFSMLFPNWHQSPYLAPAWLPDVDAISNANISMFMAELDIADVTKFHKWTVRDFAAFWDKIIKHLNINFAKPYEKICDLSAGVENPRWLIGAKMNITTSCFQAKPNSKAIIYQDEQKNLCSLSYEELEKLVNRIANSLTRCGLQKGDAIAIVMPMNLYAVAAYLAVIRMGGIVVSIADSFTQQEIAERLTIANAKAIFTQYTILWGGKVLPLYEKICGIEDRKQFAIVCGEFPAEITLETGDIFWKDFMFDDVNFIPVQSDPENAINILFSSGTTAQPKAVPWTHCTAIKAGSDAFFHQDIKENDVLAWPTNLGWMMGPWLVFAALLNKASIALYTEAPKDRAFGEFVAQAKVTMLGVVPTLVNTWRQTQCMQGLDWQAIKCFSSTGECSNPEDMLYLMSLASYKPVIEYCGGTEIGGAYVSSTMIQNNYPTLFSTAVMGIDFKIVDSNNEFGDSGEVAIIPPSMGLSTTLLNADHHDIYFANMPELDGYTLRRHGDQIIRFPNNYFMLLGRSDDAMNLGGIKVSAAEIERAITGLPEIDEVAAIGISPPHHGPSDLIVYAVTKHDLEKNIILKKMQKQLNQELNPLFKIKDIVFVKELPKTASNKIMRRILRKRYEESVS